MSHTDLCGLEFPEGSDKLLQLSERISNMEIATKGPPDPFHFTKQMRLASQTILFENVEEYIKLDHNILSVLTTHSHYGLISIGFYVSAGLISLHKAF